MKKSIISIVTVMALVFIVFYFRAWFNNNVLGSLPYTLRIVAYYVMWWLILIPIFIFMRRDKEKLSDLGFTKKKLPLQILLGILLGLVTSFALSGIATLTGSRQFLFGTAMMEGYIPSAGALAYDLFETLILVALVEEIIFRGYLYKKMIDIKDKKWLAVVVTALLFGIMHIVNGPSLLGILSPTVFGLIYGICRAYSKNYSLLSLILAHGVHNVLNGPVAFGILDLLKTS